MHRSWTSALLWFAALIAIGSQAGQSALASVVYAPAGVALQSYVDRACKRPGGVLILQGHSYTQNTPFALCSDLTVIGQGRLATVIHTSLSSGSLFRFTDAADVTLRAFMIEKQGTPGATAIWIGFGQHIRLQDLIIDGPFSNGIYLTQDANGSTIYNNIEDVVIENLAANGVGINFAPASTALKNRINSNRFVNVVIGPNPSSGVTAISVASASGIQASNENVFIGGKFYSNDTAVRIGNSSSRNMIFLGTDIESNRTQGVYIGTGNHGIKFLSCWLNKNGASNSPASNLTDNSANNQNVVLSQVAGKASPASFSADGYTRLGGIGLAGSAAPTGGIGGKVGMALGTNGSNELVFNSNSVSVTQPLVVERLAATDTAVSASSFSLNALWGSGAKVSVLPGSNDQRGQVTVTAGSSPGTNPVLTLVFVGGAWPSAPVANVLRNDTAAPAVAPVWTTSGTALTITFPGKPQAGQSYSFSYKVIG